MSDMTEKDLELLSQFIDGELADSDASALRARLLAEPPLRGQYEHMKAVNTRVSEAFSGAEFEAVPDHVAASLAADGTAVRQSPFSWYQGAVAASVLAAAVLLVSPQWGGDAGHEASFASVLDTAPSRAQGWEVLADGAELRPLLSFRSVEGTYCREYLLRSGDTAERGVACRDQAAAWSVQVSVVEALPGDVADYRPASSHDVDAIAKYVDAQAEGDVLSLADEAAAMERNWQ